MPYQTAKGHFIAVCHGENFGPRLGFLTLGIFFRLRAHEKGAIFQQCRSLCKSRVLILQCVGLKFYTLLVKVLTNFVLP